MRAMPKTATRSVDVLLVGGGVASVRCARTLRRRGFAGTILLVGEEPGIPYNRPPLTKQLLRGEVPPELIAAEPAEWYARNSVELLASAQVARLDAEARVAELDDGTLLRFDRCLLATGAAPRLLPIPGFERAHLLRTLADAERIRAAATGAGAATGPEAATARSSTAERSVAIIGGGFIGVEAAGSLASLGLRVTLLEAGDALWGGALGTPLSGWARAALEAVGVEVRMHARASALTDRGVWLDTELVGADMVVAGVGVTPRLELAEATGLECGEPGGDATGIAVDQRRQTSGEGIFAAGDVAAAPHPIADGRRIRVEHWHAAREGGEAAALGMLGLPTAGPRAPWVFSEFAGQTLDVIGWSPTWDDQLVLGDPASGRFGVAHVRDAVVRQLALVNGFADVSLARAWIEAGPGPRELVGFMER
ncbi:MAG: NAD(P)/FAD-dependent oxidoreductase [Chloroflexota bacterium]|nr:NAD(P)/FAD-dependent oxidoreductase [Chloroflexota bacterium]